MATIYYEDDADIRVLDGRTMAILGYGNQGRAQALNLRDSGVAVIVGNVRDASYARAEADGFPAMAIAEAVDQADVLFMLLPDEVQREVYFRDLVPHLRPGQTLNFSHGYNIRFRHIIPPGDVDVIMVAPRMIGVGVREHFEAGGGAPAFVAVEQDATGAAWPTALAIAAGIGATRTGALRTTFAEETELDLFSEQAIWPAIFRVLTLAFETLTDQGYQPEAVVMEAYASGEPARVFQKMADVGIFRQMTLHSQTSQYGTLTRTPGALPETYRALLEAALDGIRSGRFADEWERERAAGYPVFERLREEALRHPIADVEARLRRAEP